MLQVTTIFYSVQGEATHTGIPTIFVRLYGCNLECPFCDDLLHTERYTPYTYEQVLEEISQYSGKHVIITGGEPTINDLKPFIAFLQKHDYFVAIETNGYKLDNVSNANWITYSPKDWNQIHQEGYNELKVVVNKDSDLTKLLELQINKPFFIQAENHIHTPNMENIEFCIEFVKQNPQFRLSVQTHKFLGVD